MNGAELLVQSAGDGRATEIRRFPFFKRFEPEEDDASIGRDAEAADAQSRKRHCVLHSGLLEADFGHVANDGFSAVERRGIGQLREGNEILFVLSGNEAGWNFVEAPGRESDQAAIDDQRDSAFANHAADACRIFIPGPREEAIERPEEPAEGLVHRARKPIFEDSDTP